MASRCVTPITTLILTLLLPISAAAQLTTGTISGTVHDASGAVVPGVAVTLVRPGVIGANQTATTDERGVYQFTRLVPGTYGVKAELSGFTPATRENVVVNADATARVDLVIAIGDVSDSITVSGEIPLLDTTSTLAQTVLQRDVLDKIPSGNDLWSIGRSVPGVIMTTYDVGGSNSYQ
ncbi:MAG TPA: carboxypeptidase-like regulatory domain-containing protein, partial [Vicinamibacterales bacterium]|nr:carboxypeptidase-like regulatory domain-containing protein [Vicinamibacterales bacterium]